MHTGLGRDGPGILLRDLRRGAEDVDAALDAILHANPDVLVLFDFDYDLENVALRTFRGRLTDVGLDLPYIFSPLPNSGMQSGHDLDGDGVTGTADDAWGYGPFSGAGGWAVLSRYPIQTAEAIDHSGFLWRDLPDANLPWAAGALFPSETAFERHPLPSVAAMELPVLIGDQRLTLMIWHAGPPVFGGPHNRNFNRNGDETRFWSYRLRGALGPTPDGAFALVGATNLDPDAGDGNHEVIRDLLSNEIIQDPRPTGPHPETGESSTLTGWWPHSIGGLRTEYILPSHQIRVMDHGILWPEGDARHALIWMDLALP